MRPSGPKFWLFGKKMPWPTLRASGLGVSAVSGITLAEHPNGPLALDSPDESAGRLVLPKTMALDRNGTLYLADRKELRIRKFDAASQSFRALPSLGGRGAGRRQFQSLDSIFIHGLHLYIADSGSRAVRIFHLQTLALVEEWTERDVPGWYPSDLTVAGGVLFVLDQSNRAIYSPAPRYRVMQQAVPKGNSPEDWLHVIADPTGMLYLVLRKDGHCSLRAYDPAKMSREPEVIAEAASVRRRFAAPSIAMDKQRRFLMPETLRSACPQPCGHGKTPNVLAVRRFETDSLTYELDRTRREVRVFTRSGQLRAVFGPRDSHGEAVRSNDPSAWDPYDLQSACETAYILDANDRGGARLVWRHVAGSSLVEPTSRPPWEPPPFEPNPHVGSALWFDGNGRKIDAPPRDPVSEPLLYRKSGEWRSAPLESGIHRCAWDRVVLTIAPPPPGSSMEIFTFAHDEANISMGDPGSDPRWSAAARWIAPMEPAVGAGESAAKDVEFDFPVRSAEGERLSIVIRLYGDGSAAPVLKSMRVYYPRDSYLQYLPKVFSSQPDMRRFLEGFLGNLQVTGDALEKTIRTMEANFDPDAVKEGAAMRYLAGWLGLQLEGSWTAAQNRQLLSAVPKIFAYRGTPEAFRDLLRVYLANAAGLTVAQVSTTEFPLLMEGYAERHAAMAGISGGPLWSPAVTGRLQLGEFARLGEVSLISTSDPELDFFTRFVHRFKVFVPAAWVRDDETEKLVRRAIEAEKPAHTTYELVRVENRMRVGDQSTVGLDTILGEAPQWRLPCGDGGELLNIGTVLGGPADAVQLGPGEILLN